ncbi:fumarylacetoacetate hydrolase family protein [Pelagibacterium halotolerans]|uniref:2-keto-4-pentenoate hydratase/2-oxohepta-3-ene-1,7-dioic acid hydratase (Catechol pathway) n=1 Tax=Pelagibacterium halotolerans (strain DSM 22347 / JCM 15775 / CGMCC 1.7692 / B2) TaxID=1082931 RepID=G4R7C0_PELHB|nr:fumarylacetoacetate hydrolase family protein [Pelagibacterium halotolerans]AEQ51256.1 2-keto-4-pentenoate hydratase/2-oxohepta-3-ene-1,7-dioic acid hydratase (catechol pathway) [Pelagibacterium halotolerans B2]QJR18885.1 fumarylacetoacetate hydrolase [Pelagibacterium halotolerans]SEA67120.1 fumarylacetoacetate (FAA) hydrolase [Pelagibacterium halotolerans]
MKLATLPNGTPDGQLYVVSRDHTRCARANDADTMQLLMEAWDELAPRVDRQYQALNAGGGVPFDPAQCLAPLPRAWQWLDGSAYESHGKLMDKVFGISAGGDKTRPLMYQGLSDRFLPPHADVPLPSEEDGIDFEGEFGIVCDAVPMGTDAQAASRHIRLLVQVNDWSLRKIAPIEMKTGFGWVQAKPACSMAPVAVTPDELGAAWRDHRVDLPLHVTWNGKPFGAAGGYDMGFGFHELVAHAARTRDLVAGTIIGSGTVSNENYREVGSSCIAERRGIEMLDDGEPRTGFMAFGDNVRMQCALPDGTPIFGAIDQKVIKA